MTSCPTPTWLTDNGFIALSQQKENDPNSCFILSDEANFDYLECVDKCAMANGTIASVGSFAEERMLKRRTFNGHFIGGDRPYVWLGGYKSSLTDEVLWQDGLEWTYDHWSPSQPNGGTNELCVGLNTVFDGMVDYQCSTEFQCMCSTNTALSDDFRQFGRQDIIDSSQIVGGSSATIETVNGAVLLCVLLNFVLSRCMRSSAVKPGAPRRDSIRTTVSAVLEGGGDNIPFPFADFLLMRGCVRERACRFLVCMSTVVAMVSTFLSSPVPQTMKLSGVTFALLFPFYYNSLAKLLTGDQSHLAGVLHACSRKDDFKKFWAKKEKDLRVYGGFCAFFGFFATLIGFFILFGCFGCSWIWRSILHLFDVGG